MPTMGSREFYAYVPATQKKPKAAVTQFYEWYHMQPKTPYTVPMSKPAAQSRTPGRVNETLVNNRSSKPWLKLPSVDEVKQALRRSEFSRRASEVSLVESEEEIVIEFDDDDDFGDAKNFYATTYDDVVVQDEPEEEEEEEKNILDLEWEEAIREAEEELAKDDTTFYVNEDGDTVFPEQEDEEEEEEEEVQEVGRWPQGDIRHFRQNNFSRGTPFKSSFSSGTPFKSSFSSGTPYSAAARTSYMPYWRSPHAAECKTETKLGKKPVGGKPEYVMFIERAEGFWMNGEKAYIVSVFEVETRHPHQRFVPVSSLRHVRLTSSMVCWPPNETEMLDTLRSRT